MEGNNHFLGPIACGLSNAAQYVFGLLHVQCFATENLFPIRSQEKNHASLKYIKFPEFRL